MGSPKLPASNKNLSFMLLRFVLVSSAV